MQRPPTTCPQLDPRERAFARTLGVPDLIARVLLARGYDDPARARAHLAPDLATLHDPFLFAPMARAVERVRQALAAREPILIHGDYDVDGISGTVLLLKFFGLLEADVRPFIPDRRAGYSFTQSSLEAVRAGGHKLCISVDNGTNAVEFIQKIQELGCDVIVTDHHGTTDCVAPAHTVLNPRLRDAGYPDRELAGCGVAFRLACAIAQSFSKQRTTSPEFAEFLLDAATYVALGTIADVAPLRGENRVLVHHGLRALAVSKSPGIRALLDAAGLKDRSPDAEDIAYRIAPLLNAAGRVGHAHDSVALLMARDTRAAADAAKVLERHNTERRRIEKQLYDEVLPSARASTAPALVFGAEGWHPGVLGIVAARLAESLQKPTVLVAFDGGRGRGSGRSFGGIDLQRALAACAPCLGGHGGHAAAVGFELAHERLDELRDRLNAALADATGPDPSAITVDGPAQLAELDPRVVRKLDVLGPFGVGNHRPTFACSRARLVGNPILDQRGVDLKLRVVQDGVVLPARLRGGAARFEELRALRDPVTLVFAPRCVSFAEEGPVELVVHALLPDGA